jgi:hypothetical protein
VRIKVSSGRPDRIRMVLATNLWDDITSRDFES